MATNNTDWIIFYGPYSGYALGPFCSNPSSPWPFTLGSTTDHPQQAIGWSEREGAESALAACGYATAAARKRKIMQRGEAIRRWEASPGLGASMGVVDWGTSAQSR